MYFVTTSLLPCQTSGLPAFPSLPATLAPHPALRSSVSPSRKSESSAEPKLTALRGTSGEEGLTADVRCEGSWSCEGHTLPELMEFLCSPRAHGASNIIVLRVHTLAVRGTTFQEKLPQASQRLFQRVTAGLHLRHVLQEHQCLFPAASSTDSHVKTLGRQKAQFHKVTSATQRILGSKKPSMSFGTKPGGHRASPHRAYGWLMRWLIDSNEGEPCSILYTPIGCLAFTACHHPVIQVLQQEKGCCKSIG